MIKNLRPPSTQSFMARTIAFKEATTSEKLVPVSNNSLLKNPANNKTEPMPEHGLRPLRKVADTYGHYIVKTELKAVPVSNRTLLQAKTSNPITGAFIMRKSEPMPVPSGISKEYRKLLNLNILPAGYALNKGPKKVELAFLEKLTNDNAKKIVLEFMTNSVAGSIYKPLRIIHGGPKNIEQNAQAKEAYDSAIQEMTEMFQKGQTQGTSVQLVIDRFMGNLRRIYNTPAFNIDDYVNSKDVEEGIERLKQESFKAQQVFGGDREDANGQSTQEQMLAVLQSILEAQKAGVRPDGAAVDDVVQQQAPVPIVVNDAAAVGGVPDEANQRLNDAMAKLPLPIIPKVAADEPPKQQPAAEEPDDPDEPDEPEVPQASQVPQVDDETKKKVEDRIDGTDYSTIEKLNERIAKIDERLSKPVLGKSKPEVVYERYLLNRMRQEFGIKPKQQFIIPTPQQIDEEIDQTNNKIAALNQEIEDKGDAGGKMAKQVKDLERERAELSDLKKERPEFDPKKVDYKLPTLQQIEEDDINFNLNSLIGISARKVKLDNMNEESIYRKFPYKDHMKAYINELIAVSDTETEIINKIKSSKDGKNTVADFYLTYVLPQVIPNDEYKEGDIFNKLEKSLFRYKDVIDKIITRYERRSFQGNEEYLNEKNNLGQEIISSLQKIKQPPAGAAAAIPSKKPLTKAEKAAAARAAKAEREAGAKIVETKLASEKAAKEAQSAKIREEESKLPFSATNINKNVAYLLDSETGNFNTTTNFTDVHDNYAKNNKLNFPLYKDLIEAHQTALNSNDLPAKTNAIKAILLQIEKDWYFANTALYNSKLKNKVFPKIDDKGKNAFINYWTAYEKYKEYSKAQNAYGVEPSEEIKKKTGRTGRGRKSRKSKKEQLPKLEVTDEEYNKSTKKLLKREKSKRAFQEILDEPKLKRGATRFSNDELNKIIQSILSAQL